MCGIVSVITNYKNGFDTDEIKAFQEMLYVNALRGQDSTGIFYGTNKHEVQIHKESSESNVFLKSKEWGSSKEELYRGGDFIVGHCRAKTRGENTDDNAHPFNVNNKIILVHNGTFVGDHKHIKDVEVDSHAIAHAIEEAGEDIEAALQRINAAYALIWYNNENKTLYAIRNKERTLFYAETQSGSMLLASESSFIYLAALRNNLKLTTAGAQMLPEHTLFSVNINPGYKRQYNMVDIDAEYRYQTRYTSAVHTPQQNSNVVKMTPHQLANWRSKSRLTMLEAANELNIGYYDINQPKEHFRQWLGRGEEVVIEAVDYLKVDSGDPTDQNYYVFGKILHSDERIDGFCCGWEITCKDERDVVNYVCGEFPYFNAKIEHGLYRPWFSGNEEVSRTALFKLESVEPCTNVPVLQVEN